MELWEKGIMGVKTPKCLLNAVFYCGSLFCLRGSAEHQELKLSQFELKDAQDPSDSTKY